MIKNVCTKVCMIIDKRERDSGDVFANSVLMVLDTSFSLSFIKC